MTETIATGDDGAVIHGNLRCRAIVALLVGGAAECLAAVAHAQNSRNELPIPSSPQDHLTAIQRTFRPPPPPPLTLFPQLRGKMQDLTPFFRDSWFDLHVRSYYSDVIGDTAGSITVKEAWAAGGAISFETGRLLDVISGGAVFYTSLPLYAPLQHDGTQLLLPGQLGYAVVGQLYRQVHFSDNLRLTAGRYLYDTPLLGSNDTRMASTSQAAISDMSWEQSTTFCRKMRSGALVGR